ncbi:MAG: hypothetical protein AAF735_05630 [Myxococcota bacterium]
MKISGSTRVFLVFALALPVWMFWQLLDADDRLTGAHRVKWVFEDGSPVVDDPDASYPWDGCQPNDIFFDRLIHDGALWTTCDAPPLFSGNAGYAHIDPVAGVGTIIRGPASLPIAATEGLALSGLGELVVVYRVGELEGPLAIGSLTSSGWSRLPEVLPESAGARLFALVSVNDQPEAVYGWRHREDLEPTPNVIISRGFGDDRKIERVLEPPECEDAKCFGVCGAFLDDDEWQIVRPKRVERKSILTNVDGDLREESYADYCTEFFSTDHTAFGVLRLASAVQVQEDGAAFRSVDGTLEPLRPAPAGFEAFFVRSFRFDGTTLQRERIWSYETDDRYRLARRYEDGWLLSESSGTRRDYALRLELVDESLRVRADSEVARAPSFNCGELWGASAVKTSMGFRLVTEKGCSVHVDEELHRLDPLPLVEHLRARGSLSPAWDERIHEWKLAWVLVGLPLSVALAFAFRRLRPQARIDPLRAAALLYIASASWAAAGLATMI